MAVHEIKYSLTPPEAWREAVQAWNLRPHGWEKLTYNYSK
jgi:hypothetical protein